MLEERFAKRLHPASLSRPVWRAQSGARGAPAGFSRQKARQRHPSSDPVAQEAIDRIGQKGRVCHRWWTRGERPPGLCDQRYTWVHLFGTVRPATGDRFALVMPVVSTEAMNLFLDGFSRQRAIDEHAVMVLDQAGWHRTGGKLRVPDNVTLVALPSYAPELNPMERLWLYLRERHLALRLRDDGDAIVTACCQAGNQLTPKRINSLSTTTPYIQQVRL